MSLKSVNPATGELNRDYEEASGQELNRLIESTGRAFEEWKGADFGTRAELLRSAAAILRDREQEYARLMAEEMGKVMKEGVAEVRKCALVCDYYAENGPGFLQAENIRTEASRSYVAFRPLGVILAVMPWNFPFWQVFRFAAPALIAGNGCVLKHASNVPGCALAIERVFAEAGFPENLFSTALVASRQVEQIIADPLIRAVTLTGSVSAGKAVAAIAGKHLKKAVMELGGSDPYIILEDADLEQAAGLCTASRLINSGQSCIAAKRFIAVRDVAREFTELVVESMRRIKIGDPLDEGVDIGPLARMDLRDELHEQVSESIEMGAEPLLGGRVPSGPGAFYPPTVLSGVTGEMPAYREELFGPAASIIEAGDEEDAIRIANDTTFGLGGAVFTADIERGERIARDLVEAGSCFVNDFVRSDPRLPFGGIRESGYGRELSSFGIREFVNIKTVSVK